MKPFYPIAKIGFASVLCLSFSLLQAQPPTAQEAAPPNARGNDPVRRGGMGAMGSDTRVQNRTYLFTDTGENLPYAVFVSSKVSKDKKAPLSENMAHEYKELPGLDHGGIVMGGMTNVFAFFAKHSKP